MKFSIKYKMIALGAVLSVLVTTIALIYSNVRYREHEKEQQMKATNDWLTFMDNNLNASATSNKYIAIIASTRDYILDQYHIFPEDPPEDLKGRDLRYFYMNYFKWCYAIENMGMYIMSDEEKDFRNNYELLTTIFNDAKSSARATGVFLAYLGQDNTLFYLADPYSYKATSADDTLYPGQRTYNFDGTFVKNGDFFDCVFNGKTYRVLEISVGGLTVAHLFVQYDFVKIEADANSVLLTEIIVLGIASILMIVAYSIGAHLLIVRNMSKLTKLTGDFTTALANKSKLQVLNPDIRSRDEIHDLSESFVALEKGIINYIDVLQLETQAKERMNAELSIASNIQLSALPPREFNDNNIELRSFIKSAKEVGGDFYDYFYLDEHRFVILISDVSGKGVPASLFMMKSKELLKSAIHRNKNLIDAVSEVNKALSNNNKENLFVTSFIGVIDLKENLITYVNAGHEKPYIISKDKVIKLDGISNFVLGAEEDFIYQQESHEFNKGDSIFLFTDGLNESINDQKEEFSYFRIEVTLDKFKEENLDEVINKMNLALEEFVGNEEQFDDVTMLLVKVNENSLHLSYEKKEYEIIEDIIDKFNVKFAAIPEDLKASTGIIIDELINNFVSYEKREDLKIDVNFSFNEDLEIKIETNGADYNPFDNHQEKYLEDFHPTIEEGGFGLSIIKHLAKSYNYEYKNNHSIITIVLSKK